MNISGTTQVYCLIGDPVDHSLSPFIMNRALAENAIDGVYIAFNVDESQIGKAIRGLKALGAAGANVTFPLKESVLPFADVVTPAVEAIRAANVLWFTPSGIEADNTDSSGTAIALEHLADEPPRGKRVFIFGAGGSGRAAAFGLLSAGTDRVTLGVRQAKETTPFVKWSRHVFPGQSIDTFDLTQEQAAEQLAIVLSDTDIIINATPAGMTGFEPESLVDENTGILEKHCCFDFVYHPRKTPFLITAARQGARTLEGLALLVAQASVAFDRWTGRKFDLREMFEAVSAHATDLGKARNT